MREDELQSTYHTALKLLENLGLREVQERLRVDLPADGTKYGIGGRIVFNKDLVEEAIEQASKSLVLHGRNAARSIAVGDNAVHFRTGGAAMERGYFYPSHAECDQPRAWAENGAKDA